MYWLLESRPSMFVVFYWISKYGITSSMSLQYFVYLLFMEHATIPAVHVRHCHKSYYTVIWLKMYIINNCYILSIFFKTNEYTAFGYYKYGATQSLRQEVWTSTLKASEIKPLRRIHKWNSGESIGPWSFGRIKGQRQISIYQMSP